MGAGNPNILYKTCWVPVVHKQYLHEITENASCVGSKPDDREGMYSPRLLVCSTNSTCDPGTWTGEAGKPGLPGQGHTYFYCTITSQWFIGDSVSSVIKSNLSRWWTTRPQHRQQRRWLETGQKKGIVLVPSASFAKALVTYSHILHIRLLIPSLWKYAAFILV